MTESDAIAAAAELAPAAMPVLQRYVQMLLAENRRQNLIARSTESLIWQRHILDSLQLISCARASDRTWLDVGSGPGLPGLVIAATGRYTVSLVEPRRRRSEFLSSAIAEIAIPNASVMSQSVSTIHGCWDVISARAVGGVEELLAMTGQCSDLNTRFILPRGRSAESDVDSAQRGWQGSFHVKQSLTDPDAGIVIGDRVCRR